MPKKRFFIPFAVLFAILFLLIAHANETRPKTRKPDDRILEQTDLPPREVRAPVVFDETETNTHAESHLSERTLTGTRGRETPGGSKYGRYCENGFARAGFPNCLSRFARPSTDAYHQVGYVGGGTIFGGSSRRADEGTFGMDYSGHWFSRKTWLRWSHGKQHQGGAGRYETEGPRVLPE